MNKLLFKLGLMVITLFSIQLIKAQALNNFNECYNELIEFEQQLNNQYKLSPYMKEKLHEIIINYKFEREKDGSDDFMCTLKKNVELGRMKNLAERFHISKNVNLLDDLQSAHWVDIGYPSIEGGENNFYLCSDIQFNNRYDCLIMLEATGILINVVRTKFNIPKDTKYILDEYRFYDDFTHYGIGNRYYISPEGELIYIESSRYPEDYLFGVNDFNSTADFYSAIINTIKRLTKTVKD